MGMISMTNQALVPRDYGSPNQGPWNSTLTDIALTAQELIGAVRQEGPNTYIYVQVGTTAMTQAAQPVKLATGLTDVNGLVSPLNVVALGATAGGYFSAYAVTLTQIQSSATYGWNSSQARYTWVCVKGIGTLPLNSNTAGLTFRTPIGPSSASAGFAQCSVASQVGFAAELAAVGTATQTAAGGCICVFDFTKSFLY